MLAVPRHTCWLFPHTARKPHPNNGFTQQDRDFRICSGVFSLLTFLVVPALPAPTLPESESLVFLGWLERGTFHHFSSIRP